MKYLLALLAFLGLGAAYVYVTTSYDTLTVGSDYHRTPGDYYLTPSKIPAYEAIQRSENRILCNDDVSVTKGRVVHYIQQTNGCYGFAYETGAVNQGPHQPSSTGIIDVSNPVAVKALMKQATPYPKSSASPPCGGSDSNNEGEGGT